MLPVFKVLINLKQIKIPSLNLTIPSLQVFLGRNKQILKLPKATSNPFLTSKLTQIRMPLNRLSLSIRNRFSKMYSVKLYRKLLKYSEELMRLKWPSNSKQRLKTSHRNRKFLELLEIKHLQILLRWLSLLVIRGDRVSAFWKIQSHNPLKTLCSQDLVDNNRKIRCSSSRNRWHNLVVCSQVHHNRI